jgi:AcrR family transcriptional regulator
VAIEQQQLSRELIVNAAIAVADREGLDAVSMRRLGTELGYSGMSLYGYVKSKEELLDLMADHVIGLAPEIDGMLPWDEALGAFFRNLRSVLLEHRALAAVFTMRPTGGPHTRRHSSGVLQVLAASGLPESTAVEAYIALSCYTMGAAFYAIGRGEHDDPYAPWLAASAALSPEAAVKLGKRADLSQFNSGLDHLITGFAADRRNVPDVS